MSVLFLRKPPVPASKVRRAGGALGEAAAVSTRAEQRRAGQRAGSAQSHLISSFSEDHAAAAPKAML